MKIDKYSDIINIKFLFRNPKYNAEQATKYWKVKNRDEVLLYHKLYNRNHNVYSKIGGFCPDCNVVTKNYSQHCSTIKNLKNIQKLF